MVRAESESSRPGIQIHISLTLEPRRPTWSYYQNTESQHAVCPALPGATKKVGKTGPRLEKITIYLGRLNFTCMWKQLKNKNRQYNHVKEAGASGSYQAITVLVKRAVYNSNKCKNTLSEVVLLLSGRKCFAAIARHIKQKVQLIQVTIFNTHDNYPVLGRGGL